MRKTISWLLALLVISSMVLSACGGSTANENTGDMAELDTSEEVTLTMWSFTNELHTMAIAFEQRYPNVHIEFSMIKLSGKKECVENFYQAEEDNHRDKGNSQFCVAHQISPVFEGMAIKRSSLVQYLRGPFLHCT